jgi:hypothetical protein
VRARTQTRFQSLYSGCDHSARRGAEELGVLKESGLQELFCNHRLFGAISAKGPVNEQEISFLFSPFFLA